jgi:uncharacterized membrane protein YbhN (UPF0104 family)
MGRARARWIAIPVLGIAFLAAAPLFDVPRKGLVGCTAWIALAVALEALSVVGFILVFKLIFGRGVSARRVVGSALRALGASSLLPGGVVVGPALGGRSAGGENGHLPALTRATVAFTVITLLPGVVVVGALGTALWLRVLPGPHDALRTLPAAGFTVAVVTALAIRGRARAPHSQGSETDTHRRAIPRNVATCLRAAREGVPDARDLLLARNWKLLGALGYYAFDNAALWAAFHAYGATPSLTVIVMGYLVGSLGSAVPVPAGLGAVEGGLIGALVLYGAPAGPAVGAVLLYRGVSLMLPVGLGASAWALIPVALLRRRSPKVLAAPMVPARLKAGSAE